MRHGQDTAPGWLNPEFALVFDALRSILAKRQDRFVVVHDRSDDYYLNANTKHGKACFNSTSIDKTLFKEVDFVTTQRYDVWQKIGWVE